MRDTDPHRSRRASFVASLAGAVVLNAVAVGVVAAVTVRWQALAAAAPHTTWITAAAIERPHAPEVAAPAEPRAAVDSAMSVSPRTRPSPPSALSAPSPTTPPMLDEGANIRFYAYPEVDRPAQPDSDWNLDVAMLDAAGIETLVFEVFVDRDGSVVDCSMLEPATLAPELQASLLARVRQTTLQPAMRDGAAVASVRRIEVSVLPSEQ